MATPLAELGQNTEIDENSSGETIIRNTQTGTEVRLADFVDIVGPLGDSSNPVTGTSHFKSVSTDIAQIGDAEAITQIDYGKVSVNVGAASDSTTNTNANQAVSITFDSEFDTPPTLVTGGQTGGALLIDEVNFVNITNASLILRNYSSFDPGELELYWVAIN